MPSPTRQQIHIYMKTISEQIPLEGKDVLDIGTAGNPAEGENREWFGAKAKSYTTLDKLEQLNPDIVTDITDADLDDEQFDVIILSQTIEHIYNFKDALKECYRILTPGGYFIVDCPGPQGTGYHAENGYEDYWRMTTPALVKACQEVGFDIWTEECKQTDLLSFVVAKK